MEGATMFITKDNRMAIEKDFFRQVLGHFATGVTVVTTNNKGKLSGITVNAFCSVSLDPPLVLVCVDLTSHTLPVIRASGNFAVNMLADQQEELSRCFAMPSSERYQHFCYAEYSTAATGAPILNGVLAFVDARVVAEYPGGDHVIFLGQVEAMGTARQIAFARDEDREQHTVITRSDIVDDQPPLGYYKGQYRHLSDAYRRPSLVATHRYEEVSE